NAAWIKVFHSRRQTSIVRGYIRHFTVCPQVQVTRLQRNRDGRVERGGLGIHMAAIMIAVATINTGGGLGDGRVIRRRRAVWLRGHCGGGDQWMMAEPLGRFAK